MLELLLIRHARSSWEFPHLTDHQRPLDQHGLWEAEQTADFFTEHFAAADRYCVSTAVRAQQTAAALQARLPEQSDRWFNEDRIYGASQARLLQLLQQQEDALRRVVWFGHNPGFTELAALMGGVSVAELPTASIVTLTMSLAGWHEAQAGCAAMSLAFAP